MDGLYSVTLLLSLVGGGFALLTALVDRWRTSHSASEVDGTSSLGRVVWGRAATWGSAVALIGLVISVGVHVWWGHRPGSAQWRGMGPFVAEHVTFVVAAVLPMLAWVVRVLRRV